MAQFLKKKFLEIAQNDVNVLNIAELELNGGQRMSLSSHLHLLSYVAFVFYCEKLFFVVDHLILGNCHYSSDFPRNRSFVVCDLFLGNVKH